MVSWDIINQTLTAPEYIFSNICSGADSVYVPVHEQYKIEISSLFQNRFASEVKH